MPLQDIHTWNVRVSGRMQGVFYRSFTQSAAMRLGVNGWVRNELDGNVRALLQHHDSSVLLELAEVMRQGPPHARVDEWNVEPVETSECFSRFDILR